jgi:hypothetical protein
VAFAGPTAPKIVRLAAGQAHSAAVDDEAGLWTWGRNVWGQLGHDQPVPSQPTPARLPDSTEFRIAAGGESYSVSTTATGQALAWGRNDVGQLGNGSSIRNSSPQPVLGLEEVVRVAAGSRHGLAIGADGVLWTWGANESSQLGDGTTATRRLPAQPILDRLVGNQSVNEDPDGDVLSTATEQRLGTDPYNADTNGDGIPDGVSVGSGVNPLTDDSDSDGLTNANEMSLDTDGDGFPDGVDVFPLDPTRWSTAAPGAWDTTPPTITIWDPRDAVRIP